MSQIQMQLCRILITIQDSNLKEIHIQSNKTKTKFLQRIKLYGTPIYLRLKKYIIRFNFFITPGTTSTNLYIADYTHYIANTIVIRAHGPYCNYLSFIIYITSNIVAIGPEINNIIIVQSLILNSYFRIFYQF